MTQTSSPEPDVTLPWKRSSRCDTNTCVETANVVPGQNVYLRDGKQPVGPVLSFPADDWEQFLLNVKAGDHHFWKEDSA